MLNECQEGDGEIKGEVDITKFFAVEGKANNGKVSQLLIRKDIFDGEAERVDDLQFEDVAESVFVKFTKGGENYLVGVMHYSSYDHKPLGEKERNTDSRVQAD